MGSKRDSEREQTAEELYRQLKQDNAHTFPPSVEKAGRGGEAHKDIFPPSVEKGGGSGEADKDVFPPSVEKAGATGE